MANDKQSGSNDGRSKQPSGSGNFADDPQRANEAGKKGGQHSHGGGSGQANQSGSGRSQQGAVQSEMMTTRTSREKEAAVLRIGVEQIFKSRCRRSFRRLFPRVNTPLNSAGPFIELAPFGPEPN